MSESAQGPTDLLCFSNEDLISFSGEIAIVPGTGLCAEDAAAAGVAACLVSPSAGGKRPFAPELEEGLADTCGPSALAGAAFLVARSCALLNVLISLHRSFGSHPASWGHRVGLHFWMILSGRRSQRVQKTGQTKSTHPFTLAWPLGSMVQTKFGNKALWLER